MSSSDHVSRVQRSDLEGEEAYVLINVTSNGSLPLDVKIIGTDNEATFSATGPYSQRCETRRTIRQLRLEALLFFYFLDIANSAARD